MQAGVDHHVGVGDLVCVPGRSLRWLVTEIVIRDGLVSNYVTVERVVRGEPDPRLRIEEGVFWAPDILVVKRAHSE